MISTKIIPSMEIDSNGRLMASRSDKQFVSHNNNWKYVHYLSKPDGQFWKTERHETVMNSITGFGLCIPVNTNTGQLILDKVELPELQVANLVNGTDLITLIGYEGDKIIVNYLFKQPGQHWTTFYKNRLLSPNDVKLIFVFNNNYYGSREYMWTHSHKYWLSQPNRELVKRNDDWETNETTPGITTNGYFLAWGVNYGSKVNITDKQTQSIANMIWLRRNSTNNFNYNLTDSTQNPSVKLESNYFQMAEVWSKVYSDVGNYLIESISIVNDDGSNPVTYNSAWYNDVLNIVISNGESDNEGIDSFDSVYTKI